MQPDSSPTQPARSRCDPHSTVPRAASRAGRAAEVLAPPYDVLSSAEARERAKGKPWSFLHISKPEIDLDPAIDPYDRRRLRQGAENLDRMIAAGVLIRDAKPLLLRLPADLARPRADRARRRRLARRLRHQPHPQARATTPVKEDDRVRQIEAVNAQTGPVMMAYPTAPEIDAMLARARRAARPRSTSPPTTACATRCGWSPTMRRSRR